MLPTVEQKGVHNVCNGCIVFENHRKSRIQHCQQSELRLQFKNVKKWSILTSFSHPETCGQKVLPDRSFLIGQKIGGKCQN